MRTWLKVRAAHGGQARAEVCPSAVRRRESPESALEPENGNLVAGFENVNLVAGFSGFHGCENRHGF